MTTQPRAKLAAGGQRGAVTRLESRADEPVEPPGLPTQRDVI
jgi:hypothetical protein